MKKEDVEMKKEYTIPQMSILEADCQDSRLLCESCNPPGMPWEEEGGNG